ncbi:MAG: DnaJ family domain-containing protein [Desulfococcaceae bacterium]
MINGFEKVVEERIRAAQMKGDFDNLPGSGQPVVFEDDSHIPEDIRMAYKILKNADCLPPEIELKKDIVRAEELISGMEDTAEKYSALKKLNFLIMKLNAMRNSSAHFDIPQKYMEKVVGRIEHHPKNKKDL